MYAVIFRAAIKEIDEEYSKMAQQLRERALKEFGCIEFHSVSEGDQEVAISYWPSLEAIQVWKEDALHQQAQQLGAEKWYHHYRVEVVEILREYGSLNKDIDK